MEWLLYFIGFILLLIFSFVSFVYWCIVGQYKDMYPRKNEQERKKELLVEFILKGGKID